MICFDIRSFEDSIALKSSNSFKASKFKINFEAPKFRKIYIRANDINLFGKFPMIVNIIKRINIYKYMKLFLKNWKVL